MKLKRHIYARTTRTERKAIQRSEETNVALAKRFGRDRKTIALWKGRQTTRNAPRGPKAPLLKGLDRTEEAFLVQYRLATGFRLEHCLAHLKESYPDLSRSALHRCLKRHGVGRLDKAFMAQRKAQSARHIEGYFWLTVLHGDPPAAVPLLVAIEEGAGRYFGRRLICSEAKAASFLEALTRRFKVKAVTTPAEPPFTDPPDLPRIVGENLFTAACRRNRITHWPELPGLKFQIAAAKPRRRRRRRQSAKSAP
jgi:hypothetical protein